MSKIDPRVAITREQKAQILALAETLKAESGVDITPGQVAKMVISEGLKVLAHRKTGVALA